MGHSPPAWRLGAHGAIVMLYICLLLYIALIYIRPAELDAAWATIPFVDFLSGIAVVVGVFSLAAKPRAIFNLPHDKLLLAFWALIALSSAHVWWWAVYTSWLDFLPAVFCYFLIRASVRTETQLRGLVILLVVLNLFLAVNGIIQFHTGIGLGNVTMIANRIYGTGIFSDPNDLGMTFAMVIPFIVFAITRKATGLLLRLLACCALVVILVALYYTNSRGAIVGLSAAFICYSLMRLNKFAAVLVAALLIVVMIVAAPSRASEMTYEEQSAQSRIQSWAAGWEMLKSRPLMGVGYGQYTEFNDMVAHNSFVHTFAELGLLGAFCFVGMFYWYFKGLSGKVAQSAELLHWRASLTSSGVGVLVCSWFLSRQYIAILYVVLALGASTAVLSETTTEHGTDMRMTGRDMANIGALTVFGIALVYFSIRTMAIWN